MKTEREKFSKSLMAGSGSMLVLAMLGRGDMYGYQLIEELALQSGGVFQMKEGTLYPILHALEGEGCLSSYKREAPSGRERKYYKITRKGRKVLEEKQEEWQTFRQGVTEVLSGGASALA